MIQIQDYIIFLKDNGIISIAIASIMSSRVSGVTDSFINDIIMKIISGGRPDTKHIENIYLKINGIEFKIGKLILEIIKLIIVTYLTFLVVNLLTDKYN